MKIIAHDVLAHAAVLALENWGMMLIDPLPEGQELFQKKNNLYLSAMQFSGIMSGSIAILATCEFAKSLCRNLLGKDERQEIDQSESEDVLKELTNVLSGHFLTEAYGDDTVFELIYPYMRKVTNENRDKILANKLTLYFLADDNPIAVSVGPKGFVK